MSKKIDKIKNFNFDKFLLKLGSKIKNKQIYKTP